VLPLPEPLPPCPITCETSAQATAFELTVNRLATPPGDDALVLRGRLDLPLPFEPALDPVETGVGILVEDGAGGPVLDVLVPGGAYDSALRTGWKSNPKGWKYVNRSESPPGGIRTVTIRDLSRRAPGVVHFRVRGKGGTYPVAADALPLRAIFSVDPPTAETGQCGDVTFSGAGGMCTHNGKRVVCR
jgi:hypothetical protein